MGGTEIQRHRLDKPGLLGTEPVEEPVQGLGVTPGGAPDHHAAVVVDNEVDPVAGEWPIVGPELCVPICPEAPVTAF